MDGVTARVVLGLRADAPLDHDTITDAYRRRAKQLHPDAGGNARAFARLREAVQMLRAQVVSARPRRRSHPFHVVVCPPASTFERFDTTRPVRSGPRSTQTPAPSFADVLAHAMAG